jgi:hypothetical protein
MHNRAWLILFFPDKIIFGDMMITAKDINSAFDELEASFNKLAEVEDELAAAQQDLAEYKEGSRKFEQAKKNVDALRPYMNSAMRAYRLAGMKADRARLLLDVEKTALGRDWMVTFTLGQKTMSESVPVTIASDQDPIYVIEASAGATTCTIYNVTMSSANHEYSQALPSNCKRWQIKSRVAATPANMGDIIRWSMETGKVATPIVPYAVVPAGSGHSESGLLLESSTLYFASPVNTDVCEIIAWS